MPDAEWRAWRRNRALEQQRDRRSKLRRIDYQDVSDDAAKVIDRECSSCAGGDYSSVLNQIVIEWDELTSDDRFPE